MKLILFNLVGMLRRYKSSMILNIIGLSIAFASFVVIMIQVMYDLQYDAFHKNSDRIYRVEAKMALKYTSSLSGPLGYSIINNNPEVEMGCVINEQGSVKLSTDPSTTDKGIYTKFTRIDSSMLTMFEFETLSGDLSKIDDTYNIIISEKVALKYFNTVNATGKALFLNKETIFNVAGVFKDFPKNTFLNRFEIIRLNEVNSLQNYSNWNYPVIIMLREGADPQQVTQAIQKQLRKDEAINAHYSTISDDYISLTKIHDVHFSTGMDYFAKANYATTIALLSMAFIILLIAAINFINFATALVPRRIRNINTQKVLGSTVGVLRTSLIIEALTVSIISFGISILIVYFVGTTSFPTLISASISLSDNYLLVALLGGVAVLTGLIAGLYPAYYTTSFAPALILKGSFGLSPRGRKLRTTLIGFQFLISFILITAAIFINIQTEFMKNHDMGFNRENILNVYVPESIADTPSAFRNQLLQNPNIKGVAFGSGELVSNSKMGWGRMFKNENIEFDCFPVSTDFIDVMGMRIVDGRNFMESDSLRSDGVFIFNETAIKKFGIKIGDRIGGHEGDAEVVGVVADFNFQPMQYSINPICLYIMGQNPWYNPGTAYIRVSGDIASAKEHIEKSLRAVAPDMNEIDVYMMDDGMTYLYKKEDNLAKLVTIFSFIAIAISTIGVFGIVMFDSRYRRKEIALRKVHGSTVTQVLAMFTRYYIYMVLICFAISIPITYYIIQQWLDGFAYRSSIHWWIFAISLTVVALITIITVIFECMKAATENPVKALNKE